MHYHELLREMTWDEAAAVFRRHGVTIPATNLDQARKTLVKKHHPDTGGDTTAMALINAAYDVLKKNPTQPQPGHAYYDPGAGDYDNRDPDEDEGWKPHEDTTRRDPRYTAPEWAWAGYSGGMLHPDIRQADYTDMNYIRKRMWELSGHSKETWAIWGFDGAYLRVSVDVFGSAKIFPAMAEAMVTRQTSEGYRCRAVLVEAQATKEPVVHIIWADGISYAGEPIPVDYDSFNHNPGNDGTFRHRLIGLLDALQRDGGRHHPQPDLDGLHGTKNQHDRFETGAYIFHKTYGVGRVLNPTIRQGMARVTFAPKPGKAQQTGNVKTTSLRPATRREMHQFDAETATETEDED